MNIKNLITELKIYSYNILYFIILSLSFLTLYSCKENPVKAPITSNDKANINITPKYYNGYINQSYKFNASVTHTDSTNQIKIAWSSSDTSIVSIDSMGTCLFKKQGNINIYAKVISIQGAILATDTAFVSSDSLYFKFYQSDLHLTSLSNQSVSYNYVPFKVILVSSNTSVVTVDSVGHLTIQGLGSSYIIASAMDNNNTIIARDSIKVYVEWWKMYSIQSKITSMAFNYSQNTILLGTNSGKGIYISKDGGHTWNQSNSGLSLSSSTTINAITISASKPSEVIALLDNSNIAVSQDGGSTWQSALSPGPQIQDVSIKPDNENVVFAIGRYGDFQIYKSTDEGSTWNQIATVSDPSGSSPKLYIDPSNPQRMYIGGHGSYSSTDGGVTWNIINWPSHGTEFLLSNIDSRGYIYVQDYNWDGTLKLRLVRSTDYGSTFSVMNVYDNNVYVYGSDYNTGNTVCCVSPQTIYISTNNCQTWNKINSIFPTPPASWSTGIAITQSNPVVFIYSLNINDFGQVWEYEEAK